MKGRTYREQNTGAWVIDGMPAEYWEQKYPTYQKCNVCEHLVHPDRIEHFIDTGMNVCEGCKEAYLENEIQYEPLNPK